MLVAMFILFALVIPSTYALTKEDILGSSTWVSIKNISQNEIEIKFAPYLLVKDPSRDYAVDAPSSIDAVDVRWKTKDYEDKGIACKQVVRRREDLTIHGQKVNLPVYTCKATLPSDLKPEDAAVYIHYDPYIGDKRLDEVISFEQVHPKAFYTPDLFTQIRVQVNNSTSNPMCFISLLLLGLLMAAFSARGLGTVTNLYDLLYPRLMKPPEPNYSGLVGPIAAKEVEGKLLHKIKMGMNTRMLKLAKKLGIYSTDVEAIKRRLSLIDRKSLLGKPDELKAYDELRALLDMHKVMEKQMLDSGYLIGGAKPKRGIHKLLDKGYEKLKKVRNVKFVGGLLNLAVLPGILILDRANAGIYGLKKGLKYAVGETLGIRAAEQAINKRRAKQALLAGRPEDYKPRGFFSAPEAMGAKVFNILKAIKDKKESMNKAFRMQMFINAIGAVLDEESANRLYSALNGLDINEMSKTELETRIKNAVAALGAVKGSAILDIYKALQEKDISTALMEYNKVLSGVGTADAARLATLAQEAANEINQYNLSESVGMKFFIDYVAGDFSARLREEGFLALPSENATDESIDLENRYLYWTGANLYNYLEGMEERGALNDLYKEPDRVGYLAQTAFEESILRSFNGYYGISSSIYKEEKFYSELYTKDFGKSVGEKHELMNSILGEMIRGLGNVGYTVSDDDLYRYLAAAGASETLKSVLEDSAHYSANPKLNEVIAAMLTENLHGTGTSVLTEEERPIEYHKRGGWSSIDNAIELLEKFGGNKGKKFANEATKLDEYNLVAAISVAVTRGRGVEEVPEKVLNITSSKKNLNFLENYVINPLTTEIESYLTSGGKKPPFSKVDIDERAFTRALLEHLESGIHFNKKGELIVKEDALKNAIIQALEHTATFDGKTLNQLSKGEYKALIKAFIKDKTLKEYISKGVPLAKGRMSWSELAEKIMFEKTDFVGDITALGRNRILGEVEIASRDLFGAEVDRAMFISSLYTNAYAFAANMLMRRGEQPTVDKVEKFWKDWEHADFHTMKHLISEEGYLIFETKDGNILPIYNGSPKHKAMLENILIKADKMYAPSGKKTGPFKSDIAHIMDSSPLALLSRMPNIGRVYGNHKYFVAAESKNGLIFEARDYLPDLTPQNLENFIKENASQLASKTYDINGEKVDGETLLRAIHYSAERGRSNIVLRSSSGKIIEVPMSDLDRRAMKQVIRDLSAMYRNGAKRLHPDLLLGLANFYSSVSGDRSILYDPTVTNMLVFGNEKDVMGIMHNIFTRSGFSMKSLQAGLTAAHMAIARTVKGAIDEVFLSGAAYTPLADKPLFGRGKAGKEHIEAMPFREEMLKVYLFKYEEILNNAIKEVGAEIQSERARLKKVKGKARKVIKDNIKALKDEFNVYTQTKHYVQIYQGHLDFVAGRDDYFITTSHGGKEASLAKGHIRGSIGMAPELMYQTTGFNRRKMYKEFMPMGSSVFWGSYIGSTIAEKFSRLAAIGTVGLYRGLGQPTGFDLIWETDDRLRRYLEEKYGASAMSTVTSSATPRAKDVFSHPTKTEIFGKYTLGLNSLFSNTLGFATGPSLATALLAAGSFIGGTAGLAVPGLAIGGYWTYKLFRDLAGGGPGTLFARLFKGREEQAVVGLDDYTWNMKMGHPHYTWYNKQVGIMQGGSFTTPGMSYRDLARRHIIEKNVFAAMRGERGYHIGDVTVSMDFIKKMDELRKEWMGAGPEYDFAFGLLSPMFLGEYIGKQAVDFFGRGYNWLDNSRKRLAYGWASPEPFYKKAFSAMGGISSFAGTAATNLIGLPLLLHYGLGMGVMGSAGLTLGYKISSLGLAPIRVKCPRCHHLKERGKRCPHCGWKPADPRF